MNILFTQAHAWRYFFLSLAAVTLLAVAQPWIWGYVEDGTQDIHSRRTEEQQLKELSDRLVAIEQKHTEQAPLLEGLAVVFPRVSATSQVVDRLEQLADRQSVDLIIQNIGSPVTSTTKKPSVLSPTVVSVQVKGSATRLLQYIDAVEHVQELAIIQSWDLTSAPSASPAPLLPGSSPQYVVAMNILFYLQP